MPLSSSGRSPSASSESTVERWSRMRMTTFSPCDAGSVETRRSTRLPLTATRARPSCGRRRSAMSSPRHDLDARDERDAGRLGRRFHFVQHAVDAVADLHPGLLRLHVDVRRARLDPLGEDAVDELDDGPFAGPGDAEVEFAVVDLVADVLDVVAPLHRVEDLLEDVLRTIHLLDALADALRAGDRHADRAPERERERPFAVEVERIGGRDVEHGVRHLERDDAKLARQRLGDRLTGLFGGDGQVRDLHAEARGQRREDGIVRREVPRNRGVPQAPGLQLPKLLQGGGLDQPFERGKNPVIASGVHRHRAVDSYRGRNERGTAARETDVTTETSPRAPRHRRNGSIDRVTHASQLPSPTGSTRNRD